MRGGGEWEIGVKLLYKPTRFDAGRRVDYTPHSSLKIRVYEVACNGVCDGEV